MSSKYSMQLIQIQYKKSQLCTLSVKPKQQQKKGRQIKKILDDVSH